MVKLPERFTCRSVHTPGLLAAGFAAFHIPTGTAIENPRHGHLLSAPQGPQHFLTAAQAAAAEIIILDPLYSTHDQDENDTRAMAALCQSLLRLREASRAALIVVHHVRKSIGRYEIGSAFRGSSALHAVGDSYLLLTRPSPLSGSTGPHHVTPLMGVAFHF